MSVSMQGCGVIVKYSQRVEGVEEDLSCSGMYLGHGIVLTHATLLLNLLKDNNTQPIIEQLSTTDHSATVKQQQHFINSILKDVQAEFQVILPHKEHVTDVVGIASSGIESHPQHQTRIQSQNKHSASGGFISAAAHLDRIILQAGVYECLDSLMPASQGWRLLEENQTSISLDLEKRIISSFVILKLPGKRWMNEETDNTDNIVLEAAKEVISTFIPVHKGSFVYVESSPFGSASPSIFLNSLSHGIICNTSPKGEELMLTDARCITGSEGAPVFRVSHGKRQPCALVISPFCWRGGEWLGLTLLASLGPVLQTLIRAYTSSSLPLPVNLSTQNKMCHPSSSTTTTTQHHSNNGFTDNHFMEGCLKAVSKSVVCIKCGGSWGSGVVISSSPGVILTCAHVTYKAVNKEVVVLLSDGRMIEGSVIHESHPLTTRDEGTTPSPSSYSMWDLAVVVTSSPLTQALPLATSLPPQGVGVVVAGYGMFPSRILPTATLSRGVISKVVTLPSSSLYLPPSLAKCGSSSDSDNNPGMSDASKRNTNATHHNLKSSGDSSLCLRKLVRLPCGALSKCVPVPVVIQTTCAVYGGSSGGPVVTVHPSHGVQVVGVVVCNMQDSNSVTFPHVNLAVPIPTITTIINTFLKTKDETVLQYLDVKSTSASHLWGLTHTSQSRL